VHLVGFVIRIYHDARPPECHIQIKNITQFIDIIFPHELGNRGTIGVKVPFPELFFPNFLIVNWPSDFFILECRHDSAD